MNKSIDCWLAIVALVLQGDTYLARRVGGADISFQTVNPRPEAVSIDLQDPQCPMSKATTQETQQIGSLTDTRIRGFDTRR